MPSSSLRGKPVPASEVTTSTAKAAHRRPCIIKTSNSMRCNSRKKESDLAPLESLRPLQNPWAVLVLALYPSPCLLLIRLFYQLEHYHSNTDQVAKMIDQARDLQSHLASHHPPCPAPASPCGTCLASSQTRARRRYRPYLLFLWKGLNFGCKTQRFQRQETEELGSPG